MMTSNQLPRTFFICLSLFAQAVALPSANAQYPYAVATVPAPPSGALCDLNSSGQVAGVAVVNNTFPVYTGTTSGLIAVPLPDGWTAATVAEPVGINDVGQVVGSALTAAKVGQTFLTTQAGTIPIPLPAGWIWASGVAVNNAGEITGYGYNSGVGAVAFSGAISGSTAFPLPNGATQQETYAINSAGQTVGAYYIPTPNNPNPNFQTVNQAFVGTAANITTVTLPQPNQSVALGINDSGQVAGWLQLGPGYVAQAFFSSSMGVTNIPLPSGAASIKSFGNLASASGACGSTNSERSGHIVNNTGFVIGNASTAQGSDPNLLANSEGWVWDANGGTRLLTSLVPPPWTVSNAVSISNSGTILAYGSCTGSNCPSSGYTGYILLVPQGGACDVGGEITVGAADVQSIVNQALGAAPALNDLNQDGVVNITDVQIVMNAALGKGCTM